MKKDSVRITIDIPMLLYRQLRETARRRGCSAQSLILRSIEREIAADPERKTRVQLPLVTTGGLPINPTNEEIYDALFSRH